MKSYELNRDEINLVVKCLRYAAEYGYTDISCIEERDEYNEVLDLIQKLDPPRVKKAGWMNVYKNPITGQQKYGPVHHSKEDALNAGMDENNHSWGKSIDCLRVEWEE